MKKSQCKTSGRIILTTLLFVTSLNVVYLAVILTSQLVLTASVLLYFLSGSHDCCAIKCGYSSGDNNINKQWTVSAFTKLPEDDHQSVSEILQINFCQLPITVVV